MTLIRWTPARSRELDTFRTEVDRIVESFFTTRPVHAPAVDMFTPAVDISENAEGFVFRADLPGMSQKDVKVTLTGDTLSLRGERRLPKQDSDGEAHRTERTHGAFERSFTLPAPVRAGEIKASYRDGVLEVRVPKAEEARLREIEVQVS